MPKMSEEAEADRLTSEEFVDLIPHLPFENILQIEFLSTGWKKLISTVDVAKRLHKCNLCNTILSGYKSVLSHINGKKHLGNMTMAKYFYHPEYTFTKAQLQKAFESNKSKNNVTSQPAISEVTPHIKLGGAASKNNESQFKHSKSEGTVFKKDSTINGSIEKSNKNPTMKDEQIQNTMNKTNQYMLKNKGSVENNLKECKESSEVESSISSQNNNSAQKMPMSKCTPTKLNNDSKTTDGKSDNNKKSSLRLIPINELKEKSEVTTCANVNLPGTQNKCIQKSNEGPISTVKNSNSEKSEESNQTGKKQPKKIDQQSNMKADKCPPKKSLEDLKNKEQTRNCDSTSQKKEVNTLNTKNQKPSNLSDSKTKSTDLKKLEYNGNKEKNEIHVKKPPKKLGVELSKDDLSRKLVKNPLAAKKTDGSAVGEKPPNEIVNNNYVEDIIIIDDNDVETEANSEKPNENVEKETEPPAKKLKSASPIPVCVTQTPNNKSASIIRPNLVVIPTKSKPSSDKNKGKTSDEPSFTTKSVKDTMNAEEFSGFVGVEYVIKICRSGSAIKYECGLCELVLGVQSMQNHLLGYSHRLKFCEKHFPTAIQQFRQYIVNVPSDEHYKVMIPVLQKLTAAIEEHHGRSLPYECDERRYNLERHQVLRDVFARRHASEQRGPTFTHVIDSKQVDEFILRKDSLTLQPNPNKITFTRIEQGGVVNQNPNQEIIRPAYDPPKRINHNVITYPTINMQPNRLVQSSVHPFSGGNSYMDDETHKRMVDNFLKANSKTNFTLQAPPRSDRNEREHRSLQPSKRSHSPPKTFSSNIWSSYCRLVDSKLKVLKERFQKYRANPESHPSYKDEWLKFWHRRKTELVAIGKDYRSYDFQPDWVPFFNNRINELYDESFEQLKVEAREELSLPMTNDCLIDPKYFVHIKSYNNTPAIKKSKPSSTTNFINNSQTNIGTSASYNSNPEKTTAPLPSTRRDVTIVDSKMKSITKEIEIRDDSTPTVISVLRLLTALEEYLGSLGPKVVELLSKALQAEKTSQGRAEILLTEENCTMLETAMEKFKGLVIAGILDAPKERALKKAVSNVNALLQCTKEIRGKHQSLQTAVKDNTILEHNTLPNVDARSITQRPTHNVNEKLKQALQSVSNENDISKVIHLIEEKIAAALKAQGRTDVNRAHLEQLAAVCVLLEKKKREAGNVENPDIATRKPTFPQPLSESLKQIVGSISSNTLEQGHNKKNLEVNQMSNSQEMFSSMLATERHDNISNRNLRGQNNNTSNAQKLNFVNNSSSQGNFSNLYGVNNNESRMGENTNFRAIRQWPQQHQQNVSSLLGWPQNSGRSWSASEATSTAGPGLQRGGYQSFVQKPSVPERFRYN